HAQLLINRRVSNLRQSAWKRALVCWRQLRTETASGLSTKGCRPVFQTAGWHALAGGGLVEDGKYLNLTENQQSAMFLPLLQSPASWTWFAVRSSRDPQQLAAAMRSVLRGIDPGMVMVIRPWSTELAGTLFPSRMATVSLGVLGIMGAMLSITGIFGMAAYSVSKRLRELGIRVALGAQRKEVLRAALGRPLKLLAIGSAAGLVLGVLASRVLAFIVYQATPRDPLVLATWIPAQRALSVNPLILLREE
ncbi:MAG TPA: FtsX-like permease family protein, partial [Acidobacteriaceae bacterium]|nr:FtsX-like permease family protein [Acidobacteriaceae bacterium]